MFKSADRHLIEFQLSKVSRSFALAIKVLDEPLRDYVGLSYLLFRVLDTVEDAKWVSAEDQDKGFELFDGLFTEGATSEEFEKQLLEKTITGTVSKNEIALIRETPKLLVLLNQVPSEIRNDIESSILSMSRGMKHFTLREWGTFKLRNLHEVNLYCYFVAGLVGEMLTRLLFHSRSTRVEDAKLQKNSIEFGLFLQKVNILKDQLDDEKIGRHLVPDRAEVRSTLLKHADLSMDYILKIHPHSKPYALFCALSLFLGMLSIPYMESSYKLKKMIKPSRQATLLLLAELQAVISNPEAILKTYNRLRFALV
jgi:phytoene/squalene synthetase